MSGTCADLDMDFELGSAHVQMISRSTVKKRMQAARPFDSLVLTGLFRFWPLGFLWEKPDLSSRSLHVAFVAVVGSEDQQE